MLFISIVTCFISTIVDVLMLILLLLILVCIGLALIHGHRILGTFSCLNLHTHFSFSPTFYIFFIIDFLN